MKKLHDLQTDGPLKLIQNLKHKILISKFGMISNSNTLEFRSGVAIPGSNLVLVNGTITKPQIFLRLCYCEKEEKTNYCLAILYTRCSV